MKKTATVAAVLAMTFGSMAARAGVYADDLAKCFVSSTTQADRGILVKWMFSAMSMHKDIAPLVTLSPDQRTQFNKDMAGLFMRLMTESCRAQTRDAAKYEGQEALNSAFSLLGQIAAREIFADPDVKGALAELGKYADQDKLKAVMEGNDTPPKK